jgi:hypothetical protein
LLLAIGTARAWAWGPEHHYFGEEYFMPMRDELFIPAGHPLYQVRSSIAAWRRILNDPDLNVITAFSLVGLVVVVLYRATHYPPSEQIWVELMTMS